MDVNELKNKTERVKALSDEIEGLKFEIANDEAEHKAAKASAILDGKSMPNEPKPLGVKRQKLVEMLETLPMVTNGLNAAIATAKNETIARLNALRDRVERDSTEQIGAILGRLVAVLVELAGVIGGTEAIRLLNPTSPLAARLRGEVIDLTSSRGTLAHGTATVADQFRIQAECLADAGYSPSVIDRLEEIEATINEWERK